MRLAVVLVLAVFVALAAACSDDSGPSDEASTVRFTRAGHEATLTVEIADTPQERQTGLMGRGSLADDAGMLFVFEDDTSGGFWMKDTTIPLSIAFVTAGGSVIDIQDMEPLSEDPHRSPEPYRYAIEVNQGWFDDHGVRAGDLVQLPVGIGA